MPKCECEHICHLEGPIVDHTFMAEVPSTVAVRTPYGTYNVCEACAGTCLEDEHEAPAPRRLSRYERLERMADDGCDTWEEYRGER